MPIEHAGNGFGTAFTLGCTHPYTGKADGTPLIESSCIQNPAEYSTEEQRCQRTFYHFREVLLLCLDMGSRAMLQ